MENGEQLEATSGHPFYVPGKGWNAAAGLKVGDALLLYNGTTLVVKTVDFRVGVERVYNFSVAGNANYFVGSGGVGVHNCPPGYKSVSELRNARPIHGLDPEKSARLKQLSDSELLKTFNAPETGEIVEINDINGIVQGHHRINEIIQRANDPTSSITDNTIVRVGTYKRDMSEFWDFK